VLERLLAAQNFIRFRSRGKRKLPGQKAADAARRRSRSATA
jgi:hypothetical protein